MTRYYARKKPLVRPQGEWLRLSHDLTWEAEDMSGRDDIIVKISPDAGFDDSAFNSDGSLILGPDGKPAGIQHPGVTFFTEAIIEINAAYIPQTVTPESMRPATRRDRERYPQMWGLLAHESAHAHFTRWLRQLAGKQLTADEANAVGAANLLEEARVEHRQMQYRPQDRVWLQASATDIALKEVAGSFSEDETANSKIAVSRAAALILARVDGGSIDPGDETLAVEHQARDLFGDAVFGQLEEIWRAALETGDDDLSRMMELGRRWFELTGDNGGSGDGDGSVEGLLEALGALASGSEAEASGEKARARIRARITSRARARETEAARRQEAAEAAGQLAGVGNDRSCPVTGYRPASREEHSLARITRRALQAAYLPEKNVTTVTLELPPGRLQMRAVVQREAQSRAGMDPDAEPFRARERRHVVIPPLKVGIVQDVSSSQSAAADAAVSGAWSLARAASMIPDATVAMVTFGNAVHPVIRPGEKVTQVPTLKTPYGTRFFPEAVQAVEGWLDLTRAGTARLLVVLTDGEFSSDELTRRDPLLARLTKWGVRVLWVVTDRSRAEYVPGKIPGVSVYDGAAGNFSVIPKVINREAVLALKK